MPETTFLHTVTITFGEDGEVQKIEAADLYLRRDDEDVVRQSRLQTSVEHDWAGFAGLLSETDKAALLAELEG